MKKIFALLLLCSGLFATDLCELAKDRVLKTMDLMLVDIHSRDDVSLNTDYALFTFWVNQGVVNCSGADYKQLLETKKVINENVKLILK